MSETDAILVWGAGGHGRVVADLVRQCGLRMIGFVDARAWSPQREGGAGDRVITSQDDLVRRLRAEEPLPGGAGAIVPGVGDNGARLSYMHLMQPVLAAPLVHPRAVVSSTVHIATGTVVLACAVVNADARIGRVAIINSAAVVEHDCVLEDGVHVSPGAILAGGVSIGRGSWIGAGAIILEGRRVGANAVVGAGAVVTRDVADGVVVVGSPARAHPSGRSSDPRESQNS